MGGVLQNIPCKTNGANRYAKCFNRETFCQSFHVFLAVSKRCTLLKDYSKYWTELSMLDGRERLCMTCRGLCYIMLFLFRVPLKA